jgi:8-oxo-dGTP diphosphatase
MKICEGLPIQKYVLGFVFNLDKTQVALIRKNRPQWQAGMLNGIGGKIEEGETAFGAMIRECKEESTISITEWKNFAKFTGTWGEVECFMSLYKDLTKLECPESEEIEIHNINNLHNQYLSPNLHFLILMSLDDNVEYANIKTTN